ncbi:putative E3 ubiquitin-protein ligase SMURF1 [Blattamonas nauphoetae]|uniref:HECT-type E3 ubiquitin transferase n=1 Tax=Blattamonas nauphoetae TaxID=2049346 RepID=A0ABQ9XUF6_9EUKA|nr:putative E3 ubiquitin-protein ligase SMURF1 [Blattamonas nauphoetae]
MSGTGRKILFEIHRNSTSLLEACQLDNEDKPRVIRTTTKLDEASRQKLDDEAGRLKELPAEAIVPYFKSGVVESRYEALMDVDPETNLKRKMDLHKDQPWTEQELLKITAQIAQSLNILHKAGFLHMNIAPYYIYIPPSGPAKFSDFFYVADCAEDETIDEIPNTSNIRYAPECMDDDPMINGKSEVWSLGILMHELATGTVPFPSTKSTVIYNKLMNKQVKPVPETVPPQLRALITKMLTIDPENRPTAEELLREPCLQPFVGNVNISASVNKPRVSAPQATPLQLQYAGRPEDRVAAFLNELEKIQPVTRIGTQPITFEAQVNVANAMKEIYKMDRSQHRQSFRVYLSGTSAVDVNGIRRWYFTKLVELLIDPKELGLFTQDKKAAGKLTISSDPKYQSPEYLQIFKFAGFVLGKCLLEKLIVPFRFNKFIWKQLQGLPVLPSDLEYVNDKLFESLSGFRGMDKEDFDALQLTWTCSLPDGSIVDVVPGGKNHRVLFEDIGDYVDFASLVTLNYYIPLVTAMRSELQALIPEHVLRILTPEELEHTACGSETIDVADWKANTKVDQTLRSRPKVPAAFWEVVEKADNNTRKEILRLGTGLINAPPTGFKDMKSSNTTSSGGFNLHGMTQEGQFMPQGHMCFNALDIPLVEDVDIMRMLIKKAIQNSAPPAD